MYRVTGGQDPLQGSAPPMGSAAARHEVKGIVGKNTKRTGASQQDRKKIHSHFLFISGAWGGGVTFNSRPHLSPTAGLAAQQLHAHPS